MLSLFVRKFLSPISLLAVLLLTACGASDSGQEPVMGEPPPDAPNAGGPSLPIYFGPNAVDEDILGFQQNVWNNLRGEDRCGACHTDEAGKQQDDSIHLTETA